MTNTRRPLIALALALAIAVPSALSPVTSADPHGVLTPAVGTDGRLTLDARAFHVAADR